MQRKPRADALRNRERILQVARESFTSGGPDVSLDDVAKQAKVGPGTLYRHFPTREALLEAVYRTEVERLAAAEKDFATTMKPVEALRAWMLLFIDYLATKRVIYAALNCLWSEPNPNLQASSNQVIGAIQALADRAIENGDLRADLDPLDLLRALVGVARFGSGPDWQESARRLVDILIAGSKPGV